MAWNDDINYMDLIRRAAESGDFATAAAMEQSRNEKITGGGYTDYQPTSDFSAYLGTEKFKPMGATASGNVDYSTIIKNLIAQGAPGDEVGSALQSRINKATATPGLGQYAFDDFYKNAMTYINSRADDDKYDSLLDKITNREPFSFDPANSPLYQSYATQYTNRGKTAMQDTMGEYASLTGGLPSTAAVSAGNQAQNSYMSQLSGQIPEIYGTEYATYQNEMNNDLTALGTLQSDREYADSRDDREFSKAQTLINMGFNSGDISSALGITEQEAQGYVDRLMAPKYSGGGGGGDGGGGGGKPKLTAAQTIAAIKAGTTTADVLAAYEYYYGEPYNAETNGKSILEQIQGMTEAQAYEYLVIGQGMSNAEFDKLWGFNEDAESGKQDTAKLSAGMMTQTEWARHKNGGATGPEMQFATYSEYVAAYKQYIAENGG